MTAFHDPDAALAKIERDIEMAQERAARAVDRQIGAELASEYLGYPVDEAMAHSKAVSEIDAFFYWQPVRGGGQLLVGSDGSVMFGNASLTLDDMIAYYTEGIRTDPSEFNPHSRTP